MKRFEVGKIYSVRSIGNNDCIWSYEVVTRTAYTITLKDKHGEVKRCRISKKFSEYCNVETVLPEGNYSMCPILRAEMV